MASAATAARTLDVVVYGCTGFTGKLVGEYLAAHYGSEVTWAIAGRNQKKLDAAKARFESMGAANLSTIVADASHPDSLYSLAKQTKVVLSTVGPFHKYGSGLVAACAENGTSYVDITGESPWVAEMIAAHDDKARETGAIIVPMCGFDSIPSDIGTYWMVQQVRETYQAGTSSVKNLVRMRGGASGGTIHTGLALSANKKYAAAMNQPLHLCSGIEGVTNPAAVASNAGPPRWMSRDRDTRDWCAPFVMAPVNSQVVKRSACLYAGRGEAYGSKVFKYTEVMAMKSRIRAFVISIGMFFMGIFMSLAPLRWLVARVAPRPGTGPSKAARENGYMGLTLVAKSDEATPRTLIGSVRGSGDPGYKLTSQMVAEAALCIALQRSELPGAQGGILTPAAALGSTLVKRLNDSGITFAVAATTTTNAASKL